VTAACLPAWSGGTARREIERGVPRVVGGVLVDADVRSDLFPGGEVVEQLLGTQAVVPYPYGGFVFPDSNAMSMELPAQSNIADAAPCPILL